ncbi:hypothetical protein [Lentzea flava]|uniref:Uncharacterized protein n=1 Tax=Lentzea flava TaxID=103732 RepID=A0ABQ2VHH4_9PSEU|nr:hypothetical protein [Lentzea flava]MCP2197171.1 hypothetical protein [Lentzea flava]GGU87356.1 hypothetical protein GCM10010178_91480 [Lentzea flava]
MARQLYAVDWADASFPRVVPVEQMPALDPVQDGMTFTQAKAEVIEHFGCLVAYAREQILQARRLRVTDVLAADGGER